MNEQNDQQRAKDQLLKENQLLKQNRKLKKQLLIAVISCFAIFFLFLISIFFRSELGIGPFTVLDKEYGKCISTLPANGDYLKVDVSLKGKSIRLPEFKWNEKDYASKPGCFKSRGDIISMSNYIEYNSQDSIIPVFASIKSYMYDNE